MTIAPVLYRLDEAGEAYDVLYFCSEDCRASAPNDGELKAGSNAEWITGTVCETCCNPLASAE